MRRLSFIMLFGSIALIVYFFIASIRFLPLSYSGNFITSPVSSIQRLYFPELRGTCYNPSIVTLDDGFLLSFRWDEPDRCLKNLTKSARWSAKTVHVCLVELNEDFEPRNSPQILSFVDRQGKPIIDPTDMRILQVNDDIIGIFNTATALPEGKTITQLHTVRLYKDRETTEYLSDPCQLLFYPFSLKKIEKNWTPFVWNHELYLVYEIAPHTVIKPDLTTGQCTLFEKHPLDQEWAFGELRGGTPAILCNNLYISFFHSVLPAIRMNSSLSLYYLMGCYAFANTPPFHVKALTPAPILPKELYSLRHNRRKILYPSGLTEHKGQLIVACGENDDHIVIVSIDKQKMFQELKGVNL